MRGFFSRRGVKTHRIPKSSQRLNLLNISWKFVLKPHSLTTNGLCGAVVGYIFCKENAILTEVVTKYERLYTLKALKISGICRAKELGIWFHYQCNCLDGLS